MKRVIRLYDDNGIITHKFCTACKLVLPISIFNRNTSYTIDNHDNLCRPCRAEAWKQNITGDKRIMYLLQRIKSKAKKLNIPFDLTIKDIIVPQNCPILNIELFWGQSTDGVCWRDNSPSIDRIIPSLGYTKDNILVVSNRANRIKNDANIEELIKITDFYRNILFLN